MSTNIVKNPKASQTVFFHMLNVRRRQVIVSGSHQWGLREIIRFMWQRLHDVNFFSSVPPTIDQHQLTNQLISTRLFIVTFLLAIIILFSFLSSITIDKTFTVEKPTLQKYQQLYDQHSTNTDLSMHTYIY